ncbi:PHP domain-containing protein [Microbacterium suaedae]|uniref:PHP domain-containing protein n=1 Tax=Microbacterium suaedae TaxID=2067813 RepID=UPI000DA1B7FB|nr:PHP domain-containing protein [Microbacterium suaedae]
MSDSLPSPADLHVHSNRSDGTESPREVVRQARAAGLGLIGLTDHDTVSGWEEAASAARETGMGLLPGAEFSSKHRGGGVHVLGYLFDPTDAPLASLMSRVRDDRLGRAERLVGNLSRDYPLTWDDVLAQRSGDATIGRPHIADALVAAGHVADREEAFRGPLHPAGRYYVGHLAPKPADVVRALVGAGGVAIIAHPAGRGMLSDEAIRELLDAGLAGFELGHRENSAQGAARLREIADARNLIVTGSSDYHGAGKPNVLGEHTTDPVMLERIVHAGTGAEPVFG